jgi:hypothetical protein
MVKMVAAGFPPPCPFYGPLNSITDPSRREQVYFVVPWSAENTCVAIHSSFLLRN